MKIINTSPETLSPAFYVILKKIAFFGLILVLLLWINAFLPASAALLFFVIFSGPFALVVLFLAILLLLPPALVWLSYSTRHYITAIVLAITSVAGLFLYGTKVTSQSQWIYDFGITTDNQVLAPSKILILPEKSIPKGFRLIKNEYDSKSGSYSFEYEKRGLSRFFTLERGKNDSAISYKYSPGGSCEIQYEKSRNYKSWKKARCGTNECSSFEYYSGMYYYITDANTCVTIGFDFTNNNINQQEIHKMLSSLKQTP